MPWSGKDRRPVGKDEAIVRGSSPVWGLTDQGWAQPCLSARPAYVPGPRFNRR